MRGRVLPVLGVVVAIAVLSLVGNDDPAGTPDTDGPAVPPPTGARPATGNPTGVSPARPASPSVPVVVPLPLPPVTPTPGDIEFPDGSRLPPLNGVKVAPKVLFHDLAPFAKVTGRMRDATGREWYVHANGVRSTTYLGPDGTAVGLVSKDMPTQPTLPDEDH